MLSAVATLPAAATAAALAAALAPLSATLAHHEDELMNMFLMLFQVRCMDSLNRIA